jgi:hypothetical protein
MKLLWTCPCAAGPAALLTSYAQRAISATFGGALERKPECSEQEQKGETVGHLFHAGRSARPVVRRPGMFFPGFTTALLLFVGCPCGAAAALDAESAPASEGGDQGGLQEVVVTAQFRRQNLQDTAIAITAVNAALLEQRNQTCGSRNLMDLRGVAEQV